MRRFSEVARLRLSKVDALVTEGERSAGAVGVYLRPLKNHVLPAWGGVRVGRGHDTAGRQVISAVVSLAVRHGAMAARGPGDEEEISVRRRGRRTALGRRAARVPLLTDPGAVPRLRCSATPGGTSP